MLGRKDFTPEEIRAGRRAIDSQVSSYRRLAEAVEACGDAQTRAAFEQFESTLFNNLLLALDRFYVHRLRVSTGKDGNPLNEVELLVDSLMNNGGALRGNNVIKYVADDALTKLQVGQSIRLSADDFERLSDAFFTDLEAKLLS